MAQQKQYNLQPYPRRKGGFLADDALFPKASPSRMYTMANEKVM
jgi:hypothetical protein